VRELTVNVFVDIVPVPVKEVEDKPIDGVEIEPFADNRPFTTKAPLSVSLAPALIVSAPPEITNPFENVLVAVMVCAEFKSTSVVEELRT